MTVLYVWEGSQGGWYVVEDAPGSVNGFHEFRSARFATRDDAEAEALRVSLADGVSVSTETDCLGRHVTTKGESK